MYFLVVVTFQLVWILAFSTLAPLTFFQSNSLLLLHVMSSTWILPGCFTVSSSFSAFFSSCTVFLISALVLLLSLLTHQKFSSIWTLIYRTTLPMVLVYTLLWHEALSTMAALKFSMPFFCCCYCSALSWMAREAIEFVVWKKC